MARKELSAKKTRLMTGLRKAGVSQGGSGGSDAKLAERREDKYTENQTAGKSRIFFISRIGDWEGKSRKSPPTGTRTFEAWGGRSNRVGALGQKKS